MSVGHVSRKRADPAKLTVSATAFADLLGVHRNSVGNWLKDGLPIARRRGREAVLDLAVALQWIRKRDADAADQRLAEATADPDLDRAKARKMMAEADMAELQRDQRRGLLVGASDVEERWAEMVVSLRESVMSVPGVAVQSGLIRPSQEAQLEDLCRDALARFGEAGPDVEADAAA